MANQRQIPFLQWQRLASGREAAHWKPSKALRDFGWTNRKLGEAASRYAADAAPLVAMAMALNQQVAEWREGLGNGPRPAAPHRLNFADAVAAFTAADNPDWQVLKPATRREYRSRLKWLEAWAMDGTLYLDQLDLAMVRDMKTALTVPLANGAPASLHKAGAMLRVLRLFLTWCMAQGWIAANPALLVRVREAPPRDKVLMPDQMEQAAAVAAAPPLGYPAIALALRISPWILQRLGDLLALNRMAWREIENCAPADRAVLAGPDGRVMGFRLRQSKTGTRVDCPVPPQFHAEIEAAFARSQWLVCDDDLPARACPDFLFQRRTRKVLDLAGLPEYQFRDWRRSGMCMYRDLGVHDSTPISGHAILGKRSILDTYMPGHTRAACCAVAEALRTLQARERRKQGNV